MDRPSGTLEALAICWGVAALVGTGAAALLLFLADWTILQAIFGGAVVASVLGVILSLTVGRPQPVPVGAHGAQHPNALASERDMPGEAATPAPPEMSPRAPSPHREEPEPSLASKPEAGTAVKGSVSPGPGGTQAVEAAPATRVPSPAPVNAADPAVARPVGATANPAPMRQPAPLNGAIVSPEAPAPATPEEAGRARVSRNEAAMAAGLTTMPAPTATTEAQSYNEVDPLQPARGQGADGGTHVPRGYPDNPATPAKDGDQYMGSGVGGGGTDVSGDEGAVTGMPTEGGRDVPPDAPRAAAAPAAPIAPATPAGTAADMGSMGESAMASPQVGAGRPPKANDDVEEDANAPGSGIFDPDGNQSGESAAEAAAAFRAAEGKAGDAGRLPAAAPSADPPRPAATAPLDAGATSPTSTRAAGMAAGAATVPDPEPAPAAAPDGGGRVVDLDGPGTKPPTLDAPEGGQADDLKRIRGVGPKMERLCNELGFWHYRQIAAWTPAEVAWVDSNLKGFKGRVTRDDWVAQAAVLARGEDTPFSDRVDGGDVRY